MAETMKPDPWRDVRPPTLSDLKRVAGPDYYRLRRATGRKPIEEKQEMNPDDDIIDELVKQGLVSEEAAKRWRAAQSVSAKMSPVTKGALVICSAIILCAVCAGLAATSQLPDGVRVAAGVIAVASVFAGVPVASLIIEPPRR